MNRVITALLATHLQTANCQYGWGYSPPQATDCGPYEYITWSNYCAACPAGTATFTDKFTCLPFQQTGLPVVASAPIQPATWCTGNTVLTQNQCMQCPGGTTADDTNMYCEVPQVPHCGTQEIVNSIGTCSLCPNGFAPDSFQHNCIPMYVPPAIITPLACTGNQVQIPGNQCATCPNDYYADMTNMYCIPMPLPTLPLPQPAVVYTQTQMIVRAELKCSVNQYLTAADKCAYCSAGLVPDISQNFCIETPSHTAGGWSALQNVTPSGLRDKFLRLKPGVEQATNSMYNMFEPVMYKSQIGAGTNFVIVYKIGAQPDVFLEVGVQESLNGDSLIHSVTLAPTNIPIPAQQASPQCTENQYLTDKNECAYCEAGNIWDPSTNKCIQAPSDTTIEEWTPFMKVDTADASIKTFLSGAPLKIKVEEKINGKFSTFQPQMYKAKTVGDTITYLVVYKTGEKPDTFSEVEVSKDTLNLASPEKVLSVTNAPTAIPAPDPPKPTPKCTDNQYLDNENKCAYCNPGEIPDPSHHSCIMSPTPMPGGWSGFQKVNDGDLKDYFKDLKTKVEESTNATYNNFEPVMYKSAVYTGSMYLIVFQTSKADKEPKSYLEVQVFRDLQDISTVQSVTNA